MSLLLDVGNTRVKLARLEHGRLAEVRALAHGGDPLAAITTLDPPAGEAIWIASVFDAAANARLAERLRASSRALHFARSESQRAGLRNAYTEPERLGADRWLAMLALWSESRQRCCVVSAGTALTLDLVDADGQHLGGYIAPGLHALQRAVLGATRFEHRDIRAPMLHAPGRDTEGCVREAALAAALGMIEHATRGFEGHLAIAGGDAASLLPFLGPHWQLRPELVLEGLARVVADAS